MTNVLTLNPPAPPAAPASPHVSPLSPKYADDLAKMDLIRHYIANPPPGSILFTITPGLAKMMLAFNTQNRTSKDKAIREYSGEMARNNWSVTGDTVKFSVTRLLDGQNRLMSCIRADIPFQTHVVFGIDDDAFDRIDRGRNRSGADALKIAGYSDTINLSSAINWVYRYDNHLAKYRDTLKPHGQLEVLQNVYPTLPTFLAQGRRVYINTKNPAGMVTAFLYMFDRANPKAAATFGQAWETGDYSKVRSIAAMNTKILKVKSSSSGTIHETARAAYIVLAWNLFLHRRSGYQQDYSWLITDAFPTIEG